MNEPISAVTATGYMGAGVLVWGILRDPESAVFAAAMVLLAVGTGAFHWLDEQGWEQDLDHAGMNATYAALATYAAGGSWAWMLGGALLAAVVVEYVLDRPNRVLMGTLVWIALVAGFAAGSYLLTGVGLALMGAGFAAWHLQGDLWHGVWHVLTAGGTLYLYLAAV